MNKTQKKLFKLKALAEMCNEQERARARSQSKYSGDYVSFKIVNVDSIGDDQMVEIYIYRSSVDIRGRELHVSSWTDIPYDSLFESWTWNKEMPDDYHSEFSAVTEFIRAVAKYGFSSLKFGTYKRTFNSTDHLDFKLKEPKS